MRHSKSFHTITRALVGLFFLLLLQGCSLTPINGYLPKNYSWAYGKWSDGQQEIIIGEDYIQAFYSTENLLLPYVECAPKSEYYVTYSGDYDNKHNYEEYEPRGEIMLVYAGLWGYSQELYLNGNKRTISFYSKNDETKDKNKWRKKKINDKWYADYEEAVYTCPLIGEWQNIRSRRDKKTISASDILYKMVPYKTGEWLEYDTGITYTYETETQWLICSFDDTDGGVERVTYRRYNEKQELTDNLTRRTFSCMIGNVYSNTTYLHVLSFERDGTGSMKFYEVEPYGKQLLSTERITWELKDENTIRVYSKEATSGYDTFYYKGGVIKDSSGNVYD